MKAVITIDDFKSYFARDFIFGTEIPDITNTDIIKGITESDLSFNYDLYPSLDVNDVMKTALLYLTAHFVLINTDTADTGGQSQYNVSSKSAGGISISHDIPDWCKQGECAIYSTTSYGLRFLMLSKPYMFAAFNAKGKTQK